MKKDWIILVGCVGLFGSGFVFARLLAQFGYLPAVFFVWEEKLDIGTIFNIVAAIATALAAYAAFRSADTARVATMDSRASTRIQTYIQHQQQFDRLLDESQAEMGIAFFRRIELYDKMFPSNRHADKSFSLHADTTVILSWGNRYDQLRGIAESELPPIEEDFPKWMIGCMELANRMNFTHKEPKEGQVYINGRNYSYFDSDPAPPLHNLAEVIHRLARFGLIDRSPKILFHRHMPAFVVAYNSFYWNIQEGRTPHKII
ncbi:hypothetical protein [Pseudomonas brassicacearum]|uniref:hypothetical protein n=1 Tax=Pseudomonas brassicacearum TaxID=930166 RepID=UPI00069E1636|nr:hypothetical protein [Pseudomonas brassicacearum]